MKQPEGLALVEVHLVKDLEALRAGGEDCPSRLCLKGAELTLDPSSTSAHQFVRTGRPCPECNGSGKSPYITQAEETLAACRDAIEQREALLTVLDDTKAHRDAMQEKLDEAVERERRLREKIESILLDLGVCGWAPADGANPEETDLADHAREALAILNAPPVEEKP